MKIGILGSGVVGETLANGFLAEGDEGMRGSREPAKLGGWKDKAGKGASVGTFEETAGFGEVVVLAVKGTAAEACIAQCGSGLERKIVFGFDPPISASFSVTC